MGVVKGKKFINILTLKPDEKGLDGVISLEGTLWGLAGSIVIATIFFLGYSELSQFFTIIISGTTGNLADSFMGAAWERKQRIKNDAVNFLNTLIAAAIGALLFWMF